MKYVTFLVLLGCSAMAQEPVAEQVRPVECPPCPPPPECPPAAVVVPAPDQAAIQKALEAIQAAQKPLGPQE